MINDKMRAMEAITKIARCIMYIFIAELNSSYDENDGFPSTLQSESITLMNSKNNLYEIIASKYINNTQINNI